MCLRRSRSWSRIAVAIRPMRVMFDLRKETPLELLGDATAIQKGRAYVADQPPSEIICRAGFAV